MLGTAVPKSQESKWFKLRTTASVSLVLPMFNEGPAVDVSLRSALAQLEKNFTDFEIVVADDASTDGCAEQVEQWARKDERIKLVRLPRNEQFGGALRAGLTAGQKGFLVYTDFDLPVPLTDLPRWLEEFSDADVLTGYFAVDVKHINWQQTVISKGYNFLVRAFFGVQLRDINFGFKAVRKTVWEGMTLHSRSPFVDAELFVRARRLGLRVKQIPVPFTQRQLGTSHIRRLDVIAWTLLDMARLRWALLLGR